MEEQSYHEDAGSHMQTWPRVSGSDEATLVQILKA